MRIVLILLNALMWVGTIVSLFAYSRQYTRVFGRDIPIDIPIVVFLMAISILSARHLYNRATTKKVEWALFGLLGNVSAIFYHWLWEKTTDHWRQGRRFFS